LSAQGVGAETLAGAGSKESLSLMPTTAADANKNNDGMALHAAFNKEQTRLAEADDPEMKRYVDEQLAKRLGKDLPDQDDGTGKGSKRPKTVEELALEASVPKQKDFFPETGTAVIASVTEVPLGVEHKLKNIEATEAAKAALLAKGAKYGASRYYQDDEEDGGGGNGAFGRGQFPVRFGRMSEKEQGVLAEVAAKKKAQKQRATERKKEQKSEFKGFF
jgi:hypothetical protein